MRHEDCTPGTAVVYRAHKNAKPEDGTVVRQGLPGGGLVFVQFVGDRQPKACYSHTLELAHPAAEVLICTAGTCTKPAQPEHTPCCSSTFHGKALCCEHYCRSHFVERNQCIPESHAAANAVSVSTTKDA